MTPQQIEKAVDKILNEELYADDLGVGGLPECKAALLNLITTLQKETWGQACKATIEKAIDECGDYQTDELGKVENLLKVIELPPFNLEK